MDDAQEERENLMTVLFIPTLISLYEPYHHLQTNFGDIGVDWTLVLREILKDIFGQPPGRYGHAGEGAHGVFKISCPENFPMSDFDSSRIIHEASVFVVDAIAYTLPHIHEKGDNHYFKYIDNHDVLIYVPILETEITPELRLKAVPLEAVRSVLA